MKTEDIHSLDSLLANPSSIATLTPEAAQQLLISLSTIQPILLQRALTVKSVENAENELLTMTEVAAKLKISKDKAYELARQGVLASINVGRSVRVKPTSLGAYIAANAH